jgi:hypothetical protein
MRLIFGVLSLLVVLAIVGTVGKKQLDALGLFKSATTRAAGQGAEVQEMTRAVMGRAAPGGDAPTIAVPGGMPGATAAPVIDTTIGYQAQSIQNNVRDATNAALKKGADATQAAQP